jgi:hypothetical protein
MRDVSLLSKKDFEGVVDARLIQSEHQTGKIDRLVRESPTFSTVSVKTLQPSVFDAASLWLDIRAAIAALRGLI